MISSLSYHTIQAEIALYDLQTEVVTACPFKLAHPLHPDEQAEPILASLTRIPPSSSLHLCLILFVALQVRVQWSSNRMQVNPLFFQYS